MVRSGNESTTEQTACAPHGFVSRHGFLHKLLKQASLLGQSASTVHCGVGSARTVDEKTATTTITIGSLLVHRTKWEYTYAEYISCRHRQHSLANICTLRHDCRHGTGRPAHNCMDLGIVRWYKPNGMHIQDSTYIRVVRRQSMDYLDSRLNSSIAHDDCIQIGIRHLCRTGLADMARYSCD